MLNINEISKLIKVNKTTIRDSIVKLGFIPVAFKGKIKYYDEYQMELISEYFLNKGLYKTETLKTISEIAEASNSDYEKVIRIIQKDSIKPIKKNPLRFNENQQIRIFNLLYYERKTLYITLPSKLNNPNFDSIEQYSHEKMIEQGFIIAKKC